MTYVAVLGASLDRGIRRKGILRIPMASQAVAHAHRHILTDYVHLLNFPVTGLTQNSRVNMRPMVEIHVVWQPVNSLPFQGFSRCQGGGKVLNRSAIRFGDIMAVHALLHRWDSGLPRLESVGMAIEARNLESAGMKLVGISDGLYRLISSLEPVGLRIPTDSQDRNQNGRHAGRHNEAGIVQPIKSRFLGKPHAQNPWAL